MFNSTSSVHFLLEGAELDKAAWEAIEDVCKTVKLADGLEEDYSPLKIRTRHNKAFFAKYVDVFYKEQIGEITKEDISFVADYVKQPLSTFHNAAPSFLEKMIFKRSKNDKREITSPINFISKTGVPFRLFLLRLHAKKAVLLSYDINFVWAEWLRDSPYFDLYLTEISKFFYSFHSKGDGNNTAVYKNFNKGLNQDIFAGKGIQIFQCMDIYKIKDITVDNLMEIWTCNTQARHAARIGKVKQGITSSIDWGKLVKALSEKNSDLVEDMFHAEREIYLDRARGNAGRQSRIEGPTYYKASDDFRIGRKLVSKIKESLFPIGKESTTSEGMFNILTELTQADFLNSDNIYMLLDSLNYSEELKEAAEYWVAIQEAYYKKKKFITSRTPKRHLASLNAYLFFYLPLWFIENENTKLEYPDNANKFYGAVFVTRPVTPNTPMPLTLFEFMEKHSKNKNWEPNTYKAIMLTLKNILVFIESNKILLNDLIGGMENFVNVVTDDDIPRGSSRAKTAKEIFPEKIFKTLLSFTHKMNDVQKELISKIEDGLIDIAEISDKNIIYLSDYGIDAEVNHYGVKYKINKIPFIFDTIDVEKKNGFKGRTIYPGSLRVCLSMLETGIRGKQVRWLCESSYDLKCDADLEHYIQELTVNTNKSGIGFSSFVSSRVIKILREQAEWKNSVECNGYHMDMKFDHSDDAPYRKIFPLFSYDTDDGSPLGYSDYLVVWRKLCLGFQWFLSEHNIDDIILSKYLPVGCKEWDISNGKWKRIKGIKVEQEGARKGELCLVSFRSFVTPHGARSTIVSDSVTVLPEEFVGKFMTGQSERTVHYYAKIDSSRKERLLDSQHNILNMFNGGNDVEQNEFEYLSSCRNVNEQIVKKYNEDPVGTAKDNGLFSMQTLLNGSDGEDGLNLLEHAKAREISKHPSHLCPLNNKCPKELIERFGETQLCGICPYAINHVEHLPAISAAKDKAFEVYEEYKFLYKENIDRADVGDDEKYLMEKKLTAYSFDAIGWELREIGLIEKKEKIENGVNVSAFLVERPEEVSLFMTKIHLPNDQSKYLAKRLGDVIAFPMLDSPRIRARFEFAARKLHMIKGNITEAMSERRQGHPAKELYSLIKSFQETSGLELSDIFRIIRSKSNDFLHDSKKYLAKVEGDDNDN